MRWTLGATAQQRRKEEEEGLRRMLGRDSDRGGGGEF